MVKNLLANAEYMGLIPGPGTGTPYAAEQRSVFAATVKPMHLEPVLCGKRGHCNEKPVHRNEEGLHPLQLETARASNKYTKYINKVRHARNQ